MHLLLHLARSLVCACLCMLLGGLSAAQAQGPLIEAQWSVDGEAWQTVSLPDDWGLRGVPRPGPGRYRIRFDHPEQQELQPWALWSARLPIRHRIWLNGVSVSDTWDVADSLQPRTTPLSVPLPVALLKVGVNDILIEEWGGRRAGLGPVWLGPAPQVATQALAHRRVWVDLCRFLNGLAGGAAVFALALWARRRSEVTMGWFGVLALITALRNIAFVEPGSHMPAGVNLAMYLLVVVMNLLLGLFAASMSAERARGLRNGQLVVSALAVLAGLATGGDTHALQQARQVVYPLLTATGLVAAVLLCRVALRLPQRSLMLLAGVGLVIVFSAGYDALLQAGRLPQHWEFLLPWTSPLLALGYTSLLGGRLVRALNDAERAGQVLEQRVRERTAALEAANQAKTRFLAAASHDLRQPMMTIGVLIGVLREQVVSPTQQRLISRVDAAVAAMEGLLAGLLDLSRLDTVGLRVARGPVALELLLEAVAADARELASHKGLALRLRVPPGATALGDAVLIEQVLRNLVTNALRYTDQGGVLVGVRRRGDGWRIAVWDTGRGIAPEQQARVFEDFVQLDNPQRDRALGLGLGLGIVRRAVALLGTQMLLHSVPQRGSCFSFDLPAVGGTALPANNTVPAAHPGPAAELPELAGRQVCLVDDDGGAREALQLRLQAWGAQVQAFASLQALGSRLAAGSLPRVDLIVTDMRLPQGNGLDVIAQVHAAQGPVPAVIVTGNTAPDDLALLGASGLAVVHKPFRAEQLAAALRRALSPS